MKLFLKKLFITVILSVYLVSYVEGRHIIGGDVTYECLNSANGQVEYLVTLVMYRDASDPNAADYDNEISFGIFRGGDDSWVHVITRRVSLLGEERIIPESPSPCLTIPTLNIFRGVYQFRITLDIIDENYMFAYQRCCRNNTINNINNPGDQGAAFITIVTPEGQQTCNNSPEFKDFPPIVICAGQRINFDHGATDAEGDQLEYSFCAPLTAGGQGGTNANDPPGAATRCDGVTPDPMMCRPPFDEVSFIVPLFTAGQPMSGNPVVSIDPNTGIIRGIPEIQGQFVVGVCVKELRNGQLIGEIRRDFQFNVEMCTVNVEAELDAELVGPQDYRIRLCGQESTVINNISEDQTKIFNYDWAFDLGGGDTLRNSERSPLLTFPGVGDYRGRLILNKTDSLCADTASILVNVYPAIDASFNIDYDTCIAGPVTYTDASVTGDPRGIATWMWDYGDGDVSTTQNPIHSFDQPGEYLSQLIVSDQNNCRDTITDMFTWAPVPPLIIVEPSNFLGCAPGVINFNNLSEPVNELYDITWNFGDGTSSNEISPSHIYEEPGIYTVDLTIVSPFGCTIGKSYNNWIEVRQKPVADFFFTPEEPNIFNKTVSFTDQSTDAINWTWEFANLDFSIDQNPIYTFPDTGFYEVQLIVQHPSGCTDTLSRLLEVEPIVTLFFPNAFTPNNDGLNEEFKGVGFLAGISNYSMSIWNRWGERIFQTDNPEDGWNGRVDNNGSLAPEGVYVYTVDYINPRGEQVNDKGTVTIVR